MKSLHRLRVRATLGLLLLILAAPFVVRLPFLAVSVPGRGEVLYLPMYGGRGFSLSYLHSVHRTPVRENFSSCPGGSLVLTSTVFDSLGVGIPFLPGEGKLDRDRGRFVLTNMNRVFPEISLMVYPLADHALIYRGKRYELGRVLAPGTAVNLRVVGLSPAGYLWQSFANRGELLE